MVTYLARMVAGTIANGTELRKLLANLRDGYYIIEIKEKRKRSLGQNAYFHGVMLPIVTTGLQEIGWDDIQDAEDAKELVKDMFARYTIVNKKTGEMVTRIKPTHKMTTVEFMEFVDKVIKWGAEFLGVQIPYPNEVFPEF